MSEQNKFSKEQLLEFFKALREFDDIQTTDDYTNAELEQAILELSQERKQKKDSE